MMRHREHHAQELDAFRPIAVREAELSTPLPTLVTAREDGGHYELVRVVARLHGAPLGMVDVPAGGGDVAPETYAPLLWAAVADAAADHLAADGLPAPTGLPSSGLGPHIRPPCVMAAERARTAGPRVSVLICTRNRPDLLERHLPAVLALDYHDFEVVVADGSAGPGTADVVERFEGVRYVNVNPHRRSVALNRGLAVTTGDIIAFTDDDAEPDRAWLAELTAPFADDSRLGVSTGAVLPLELEAAAQLWYEESGGFTDGFRSRTIDLDAAGDGPSLLPWATGKIGAGVNMAWRRVALDAIGGFDPAMDFVRPLRSGPSSTAEDLAAFFDVLLAGWRIRFEPRALVYHEHRRDLETLERQIYWHGIGITANLTRCLLAQPRRIPDFIRRVPAGVRYGFAPGSARNRAKSEHFPRSLTRAEIRGVALGPLAFLRGYPQGRRAREAESLRT